MGTLENQQDFTIKPYGPGILLGGVSQAGKSTFAAAITENLIGAGYQVCLIDPEGDYIQLPGMVTIGNDVTLQAPEEIAELLKDPRQNLIVCMLSVPLADRSAFFGKLWARLFELRRLCGHSHWIILNEAHHLTPSYAPIESTVRSVSLIVSCFDQHLTPCPLVKLVYGKPIIKILLTRSGIKCRSSCNTGIKGSMRSEI